MRFQMKPRHSADGLYLYNFLIYFLEIITGTTAIPRSIPPPLNPLGRLQANLARRVTWARPWSRHREPSGLSCFTGETKMTPWPVGRARHAHKENVPPRSHGITGERDKTKQAHKNPSRICYFLYRLFYYFFSNHFLRVSFCRLSRRREWLCHFKKTQGEGPRL